MMNYPSQIFSLPWWLSPIGSKIGLPFAAAGPGEEQGIESWRTVRAQGSSLPGPALPIPSAEQQRGLLGSINAGANGGLLGVLTSPLGHFDATGSWGAAPTPLRGSPAPMAGGDDLSLTSRGMLGGVHGSTTDSEPRSPSLWNTPAVNRDADQSSVEDSETLSVPQTLSDVAADNYWMPGADYVGGGHHEFPQANYKRMPPGTQKVFDAAKSGPLFVRLDGRRHEFDRFHREYNKATGELLGRFMQGHNIAEPEQMTPDHAHALLRAIAESNDPRIQSYREFIRLLRLFPWLRGGWRGNE